MMLKLTEHAGITIVLLYKQKPVEILIFGTFIAKFCIFWIFAYFSQNIAIFRSGLFLWRHNYVKPWPIVLILVWMDREGPYIRYQNQFHRGFGSENLGRGCNNSSLVRRVTKNSLVRRGLRSSAFCVFCIELSLHLPSFKVRGLQMTINFALVWINISSRHSNLNFAHHNVIYCLLYNDAIKNQH